MVLKKTGFKIKKTISKILEEEMNVNNIKLPIPENLNSGDIAYYTCCTYHV